MTSHDAVAVIRRLLGVRKVGHTGTLDPGAAGVLPIAVGKATRLVQWMQSADKSYRAEMTLGVETDTLDGQGATTAVVTDFRIPPSKLVDEMQLFLGHIMQVPPMVSSVKVDGERLYRAARRGEVVEREARAVRIDEIKICKVWPDDALDLEFGSRVLFDVTCSKGTYIRSLCADIGRKLGCGAHLSFLVRTRTGPFKLEETVSFEEIEEAMKTGRAHEMLLPLESAVVHMPRIDLSATDLRRIQTGQALEQQGALIESEFVRFHGPDGRLVAIGRSSQGESGSRLQPVAVLFTPGED